MSWRILYIEETEKLSLYLDNIKIHFDQEELLVPLSDVHSVILDNYKTTLSVHLINALSKNNINIVVCGIDHLPQSTVIPLFGNHLAPQVLKKQVSWPEDIKKFIQQKIIIHKIDAQYKLLSHIKVNKDILNKIQRFKEEVSPGDPQNREGLTAKMYFRQLYGQEFKRFNKDVINAGLNYGYAILRSQITKVLVSKGLHTSIGFFHRGPNNYFNLSDDFIEPFRPIIDAYVKENLTKEEIFKKEHRLSIIKQTTKNIYINGKSQTIFNAISIYIDSILKFIETGNINDVYQPIINFNEL